MSTARTIPESHLDSRPLLYRVPVPFRVSEPLPLSEPDRFFSLLYEIEDRVSREALSLFAARDWQGEFGYADWLEAEHRLLDCILVQQRTDNYSSEFRFDVGDYATGDLALHVEGNLLCLCAIQSVKDEKQRERMFWLKLTLPEALRCGQVEAWREGAFLNVRIVVAGIRERLAETQIGMNEMSFLGRTAA